MVIGGIPSVPQKRSLVIAGGCSMPDICLAYALENEFDGGVLVWVYAVDAACDDISGCE